MLVISDMDNIRKKHKTKWIMTVNIKTNSETS